MLKILRKTIKSLFSLITVLLAIILGITFILTLFYPLGYREEIIKYSEEFNTDPFLIASIINVESNYNKNAKSHKEAKGLMQISPTTGKWASDELGIINYNEDMLYIPEINIRMGSWYISRLNMEFNGDTQLVIAAYNGGSGNIKSWLEDENYCKDGENLINIPFKETEEYIEKVNINYKIYKRLYSSKMYKDSKFTQKYFNIVLLIRGFIKRIRNILNSF